VRSIAKLLIHSLIGITCLITDVLAEEVYVQELDVTSTSNIMDALKLKSGEIKAILVVDSTGNVHALAPYKQMMSWVQFPLAVTHIENAPDVITIIPYRVNPVRVLICWWEAGNKRCI